jgi:hypothetical protein
VAQPRRRPRRHRRHFSTASPPRASASSGLLVASSGSNNQHLAQTLREESQQIRWDLQRFLLIRNKLVHRARIVHPLIDVVSERARRLLYDLLRDISAQLATGRLRNSVSEVLTDYRDTFDDLLTDLGTAMPPDFVDRIMLA